ncbi:hypothetical protein BCR41DRAFT_100093 [Lobosporangium transversale]|uniref:Uncharacterized protein n=1 Tax=Lobosporangium transversale TaxID=64571 RepID=A0A1Y2GJ45_9FUNG|nr:hypothetical protein BCR41DRAFT_100093 [Lobosporangium transversale]ORZ12462.1 hypothetical protein BCR41DRAFT_100093 [Lobosporangium transversale]|eukprot:XP_021880081.1 hypothetical protein BCR41DRAFT_100093 [Lobosporangium transversale]
MRSSTAKDTCAMDNVQASMEMSYWLRKRIDQYGSATMPQFAEKFKLSNRQDADLLFSHLISKSSLRKTTRHTLRSDYDIWKRNEGDQFWAALEATTQIASDIVVGSVPKARKLVLGDNHPSLSKPSTLANECSPTTSRKRDRESFEGSPPASILF